MSTAAAPTAARRLVRYTSIISPRVDPFLSLAIGVAAYYLHERDAVANDTDKLLPLLRRKFERMSSSSSSSSSSASSSSLSSTEAVTAAGSKDSRYKKNDTLVSKIASDATCPLGGESEGRLARWSNVVARVVKLKHP
ncbi:hypothetical protein BDZ88DRAFT_453401 [Geranomyces variabilis]|nr:hypothetical protein BDZ88DRAFT_453401 [Geranomyces variabilis]